MNMRVLVVEDDEASLHLMQSVLEDFDVQVHSFGSGRAAKQAIQSETFDCLCLDLEMPDVHGFELARCARASAHNRATPIIIVTGRDERDTMKESFGAGCTFFLQKPVDRTKLKKLLSSVWGTMLNRHKQSAQVGIRMDVSCRTNKHVFTAKAVTIGQQEIVIEGTPTLAQGTAIHLAFTLPGQRDPIDISGAVESVAEQRVRVRFTNVSRNGLARLRELVEQSLR